MPLHRPSRIHRLWQYLGGPESSVFQAASSVPLSNLLSIIGG